MDNIYKALNTIKEICANNVSCVDCPFKNNGAGSFCGIKNTSPVNWNIQQPKNRYFKED